MKKNKQIPATFFLLLFMAGILAFSARKYYAMEQQECFERLKGYTEEAGEEIKRVCDSDRTYLERLASLFAQYDLNDAQMVGTALSLLGNTGMISRLELLLPGDRLITEGEVVEVSGRLSFEEIAAAGPSISRRTTDLMHPDSMVLRHMVPVQREGRTIAVLCAVTDLAEFPRLFPAENRWGDMQMYVVEGGTGNFLQDTRHDTLGNVADLGERQTKRGYSWEAFTAGLKEGTACEVVFLSKTDGKYFYAFTAPVGVEDWRITVNVPEAVIIAQAVKMLGFFCLMAALLLTAPVGYFFWLIRRFHRKKDIGDRQLRNVSYILEVEKELFEAHLHPERFVLALGKVADYLSAETAFFWLVDDLPSVPRRLWSNHDNAAAETDLGPLILQSGLFSALRKGEGLLSYDMAALRREFPSDWGNISGHGIQSLMLIPVAGEEGRMSMVLGACNMTAHWKTTAPLEQVSFSFLGAVNHYDTFLTLSHLGHTDSLTGLMNRNSYHADLDKFQKESGSLSGIYIDVNGLHELNNHLGHSAGDEMLKAVADELKSSFLQDNIYRIGGDEFVVLCRSDNREELRKRMETVRGRLHAAGYDISIGIARKQEKQRVEMMLQEAETAMQEDKKRFYQNNGNSRRIRMLDERLERTLTEKQDADAFLTVLAPFFKGVYFVNLSTDTIRNLFIPDYFESCLQKADGKFGRALLLYAEQKVKPKYLPLFEMLCDYQQLGCILDNAAAEFHYEKTDGESVCLRILKFKDYTYRGQETLWIFSDADIQETHSG